MPFVGNLNGETVLVNETNRNVTCTHCDGKMTVVESHSRDGSFVARHFRHLTDSCGESDQHKKMKSIMLSKMRNEYPNHIDSGVEKNIGENRRSDVWIRPKHGNEIVGEVQYQNEGKNVNATVREYHRLGYDVWLAYERDYSQYDLDPSIYPEDYVDQFLESMTFINSESVDYDRRVSSKEGKEYWVYVDYSGEADLKETRKQSSLDVLFISEGGTKKFLGRDKIQESGTTNAQESLANFGVGDIGT